MAEACELLERAGRTGNPAELRGAQELFVESRRHARVFNAAYGEFVADLRRRAAERGRMAPRAARLGGGPPQRAAVAAPSGGQ